MQFDQPAGGGGVLISDSALAEAKRFLAQGSLGAARFRFEDVLQGFPGHPQATAFVAWIDYVCARHAGELRAATAAALDLAIADKPDAELYYRRALLYRIEGRLGDATALLEKALRIVPGHAHAKTELIALQDRRCEAAWPTPTVEDTHVNAKIIVQRRIFNRTATVSFSQDEVRLGSSDRDDVVVSGDVFAFVARRHCTLLLRQGCFFVRRNASLGRVWVDGQELAVRVDTSLRPGAVITLCNPTGQPPVAFRAFGLNHVHDLTWQELASS